MPTNDDDKTTMYIGGAGAVAALGIIGYAMYKNSKQGSSANMLHVLEGGEVADPLAYQSELRVAYDDLLDATKEAMRDTVRRRYGNLVTGETNVGETLNNSWTRMREAEERFRAELRSVLAEARGMGR